MYDYLLIDDCLNVPIAALGLQDVPSQITAYLILAIQSDTKCYIPA